MEIIFTLILLIGFGINSHRFDSKRYEQPKQSITSSVQQEIQQEINALKKQEVTGSKKEESEISELKEFSNDASPKGKYISVRITDSTNNNTG